MWGQWQIGHTGAEEYAARLRTFANAMRAADPGIRIVAVGDKVLSDAPDDAGRLWNAAVLEKAGDYFEDLSFHLYQPDQEGWREQYDPLELHHQVVAAPLDVERMIGRISAIIDEFAPGKNIRIALDEWNLWLPAPEKAKSMHQVVYTARDALVLRRNAQRVSAPVPGAFHGHPGAVGQRAAPHRNRTIGGTVVCHPHLLPLPALPPDGGGGIEGENPIAGIFHRCPGNHRGANRRALPGCERHPQRGRKAAGAEHDQPSP